VSLAPSQLLRHERAVVLLALAGVTAIAWLYLFIARQDMDMSMPAMSDMPGMRDMAMPFAAPWVFAMWWVMMLGMMLPSAAPMILTFAALQRRKRERAQPYVPTAMFVAGYLVVWGVFSLAATAAQWALQQGALLSPMLALTSPLAGGVLFILAGIYQLTPLKNACLHQCRSPFAFVLNHWRDGRYGALHMGASHGLYCLGCCWALMALLFVGGAMNLLWIAALTLLVAMEKLAPKGELLAKALGALMIGAGAAQLIWRAW
jgi:predicted metal-binding membrane protein